MSWLNDNDALWGFLALPLAILIGAPSIGQLILAIRDSGKSTQDLYRALRETGGRVRGPTLMNTLASSLSYYPTEVSGWPNSKGDSIEKLRLRLAEGERILLMAPAGSGKTRMLEELHKQSYLTSKSPMDPLIEIINLAEFSDSVRCHSLLNWVSRTIARRYGLSWRSVRKLVAEAKVVVAFDGLDEVSPTVRPKAVQAIAALAETHPTIVTARISGGQSESPTDIENSLPAFHNFSRGRIRPLTWAQALTAFASAGIPTQVLSERAVAREFFRSPLHLGLFVSAWKNGVVSSRDILKLARDPSIIWQYFLDALRDHSDQPLLLAGLLSADHTRAPGSAFQAFPIQLAGISFTVTRILAAATVLFVGRQNLPVTSLIIAVAILLTSVYPNATFFGRFSTRFSGQFEGWKYLLLSTAIAFVLVHALRAAVWSVANGGLTLGEPRLLADLYWLATTLLFLFFMYYSPFSLATAAHNFTTRSQERILPSVTLLAGAAIWHIYDPSNAAIFWVLAYFISVSIYLTVSTVFAWLVVGLSPWSWTSQLDLLVQFGVLARAGSVYRFTHAHIQQRVLLQLAEGGPRVGLLWRSFGAHWPEVLLRDGGNTVWRKKAILDPVVHILIGRSAWSPGNVNIAMAYFQWISIEPTAAANLMRKHMRLLPRSSVYPCSFDARDRVGDVSVLACVKDALTQSRIDEFDLHWCFRILERHLSLDELVKQVRNLIRTNSDKRKLITYLHRLSMRLEGTSVDPKSAEGVDERILVAQSLLEAPTADLDAADKILMGLPSFSIVHAKRAQLAYLRGDSNLAEAEAGQALDQFELLIGYQEALEVMVTAAVFTQDPEAIIWVERALKTGLRLRFRDGLMQALGISDNATFAALFEDPPLEHVG